MNKATLKALRDSIEHWRRMEDGKQEPLEEPTSKSCALCEMFYHAEPPLCPCNGCPVSEMTGELYCKATPYYLAWDAWRFLKNPDLTASQRRLNTKEFRRRAKPMREFLETLLPVNNPKPKPKRKG